MRDDFDGGGHEVYDLDGILGPPVRQFVERHVRSLLTWDILVFFHKNPEECLEPVALAARLGRRPDEVHTEIDALCAYDILHCDGALVRYDPPHTTRETIGSFVDACQDRGRRLALIALVLHRIAPAARDQEER